MKRLLLLFFLLLKISSGFGTELMLYYSPNCPYSKEVLKYIEETGREVPLCDITKDPEGKKRLKSYGEPATVPCLSIDGQPLYNSGAIIEWLSKN